MGYRRISASAVAMRMAVSIGVAVLVVMATVVSAPTVAPEVRLSASSPPCTDTDVTCALILGGTTVPTPDSAYIDAVRDHFIAPTHPGQDIDYIPVTAPMEFWPITGPGHRLRAQRRSQHPQRWHRCPGDRSVSGVTRILTWDA